MYAFALMYKILINAWEYSPIALFYALGCEDQIPTFFTESIHPEEFKDLEGGITQAKLSCLRTFFINDISGGNILSGAARNFFLHQTSAQGPEAIALNYVMEVLS